MRLTILIIFLIAALFSGCSTVSQENSLKLERLPEKSSVVYTNAEHRVMMITNSKDLSRFCAEPPPDASISVTDSESEKVKVLGKEEGMADTSSEAASSLGGRNSTVLLARDILYRVCELSSNTNANYDQSKELFLQALKTIEILGGAKQASQFSKIGATSTINETLSVTKTSANSDNFTISDTKSKNTNNSTTLEENNSRSPASTVPTTSSISTTDETTVPVTSSSSTTSE